MDERSFEEIAATVYPNQAPQRPPVEEQEETTAPAGPPAVHQPANLLQDLVAGNDRLMSFLEDDIERLEAEAEADRQMIERNMRREE